MPAPHDATPSVYPCLRYRDAVAAIAWLEEVFGFEERMAMENPDGTIAHAELKLGPGYVMLGSAHKDAEGNIPTPPPGPREAWQSVYIALDDVDGHHERARAAGAVVTAEPYDTDYGSREYSARDPEGYLWTFGTYRPAR
ncbi:Glyoxalase-like domain protein [Aquisphaera giovannonii]|uniref:Glyoxalase-like domain protein n=1 Tax=Aquisphaera giovannonii TaxID=406548 RepID=A0A5B9W7C9_9BACT|nr:VOC family protein [Aquisphaera giovannonii]QEH36039.1 Glyoxalase-like domain protein [Aquisphaera giovannonii]